MPKIAGSSGARPQKMRRGFSLTAAALTAALVISGSCSTAYGEPDNVNQAIEELNKIEAEATQISRDLDEARAEQAKAERKLRTAEAEITDQEQRLSEARAVVARVAIAQQQQGAQMSVAGFLFSSPDDGSFLRDMATAHSVSAITGEQMTRMRAEADRLADLKRSQTEALASLDEQIAKQTELQAEYEVRVKNARDTVSRLSANEVRKIEQIRDERTRAASTKQLASALAESSTSRAERPLPAMGGGQAVRPADGPITSPYGYRVNPIGGYTELHDGIDFGSPCGSPIRAAWSGMVLSSRYEGGWGNRVIIDSGNTRAAYAHMNTMTVQPGQMVQAGQAIGSVGTTGYSTGCHLHFSTWVGETLTDPASLI